MILLPTFSGRRLFMGRNHSLLFIVSSYMNEDVLVYPDHRWTGHQSAIC